MPQARLFPDALFRPGEIVITPWSYQSLGVPLYLCGQSTPGTQNFVTANLAVFVPFGVPEPVVITRVFWQNGSAVAGNIDVGIYAADGTRLVSSGSIAQVNVNVPQFADVTDTVLPAGLYYLAMASDTSGATQKVLAVLPTACIPQSLGLLQMATAFPLPAPATFAKYVSAFVPLAGAQGYRAI